MAFEEQSFQTKGTRSILVINNGTTITAISDIILGLNPRSSAISVFFLKSCVSLSYLKKIMVMRMRIKGGQLLIHPHYPIVTS